MAQVFKTPGDFSDGLVFPRLTGIYLPTIDAPVEDGLGIIQPWGVGPTAQFAGEAGGGSVVGVEAAQVPLTGVSMQDVTYDFEGLVGPQGPPGPKGDPGSITTIKQQVFVPYGAADLDEVLAEIRENWQNEDTILYSETSEVRWDRPWDALSVKAGVSSWYDASLGSDGEFVGVASASTSIFISTDGGDNWTEKTPGAGAFLVVRVSGTSGRAVALPALGWVNQNIYTTVDSGANWASTTVTTAGVYITGLDQSGANALYLGVVDSTGIHLSSNFGSGWTKYTPDAITGWLGIGVGGTNYAVAWDENYNFYRTANWGTAWAAVDPAGGESFTPVAINSSDDGQYWIVVGTNSTDSTHTAYRSADYGATWTAINPTISGGNYNWTKCQIANNGRTVALSRTGALYLSFDAGTTWEAASVPASGSTWVGLAISGDGTVGIVGNNGANNEWFTNSGWYKKPQLAETSVTALSRTLLGDSTAADMQDTIELGTGDSPEFTGLTISSLTATRLVATDGDKALVSSDLVNWVTGTANQITVTDDSDGTITLSGPQDLHTGATPTFLDLILSSFSQYSVPFFGSGGTLDEDTNFNYVSGTGRLGVGGTESVIKVSRYSSDNNPASIQMRKYRGTSGSPLVVQVGDKCGGFENYGYDGSAISLGLYVGAVVDDTVGVGDVPMAWVWAVGAAQTEKMRMSSDGYLGIGETSPGCELDASGSIRATDTTAPTAGVGVEISYNTGADIGYVLSYDRGTSAYKPLEFQGSTITISPGGTDTLQVDASQNTKIGDAGTTNYTNFANDGELNLHGTARVMKEFQIEAIDLAPGASGATLTSLGDYPGYAFTIGDDMLASFEVPHDWDTSTNLAVVIYWAINEAYGAGAEVQWAIDWSACPANASEAIDSPTHTGSIDYGDQNIPATAKYLTKTGDGTIAAASLSEGDLVGLTISRVALDDGNNPTAEPIIFHIEIHYTSNRLGEAT